MQITCKYQNFFPIRFSCHFSTFTRVAARLLHTYLFKLSVKEGPPIVCELLLANRPPCRRRAGRRNSEASDPFTENLLSVASEGLIGDESPLRICKGGSCGSSVVDLTIPRPASSKLKRFGCQKTGLREARLRCRVVLSRAQSSGPVPAQLVGAVPRPEPLEGGTHGEDVGVGVATPHDLHADRQAALGKPGGVEAAGCPEKLIG